MASSHISTQIGVLLTILVSTVHSQMAPTDPALFANLVNSAPPTAGPAAQPPMDLSAMLANSGSFPQSGFSGGLPPSGFPQMQMPMPNMAAAPQPRPAHSHNPMLLPLLFRGSDMGQMMAMMSLLGGGAGGAGGGMGGMMGNPLVMSLFMNSMM